METYIIAEAGVNHNGNLNLAKKMVDEAKKAGANCIKFQTFVTKNLVSRFAQKAEYQKKETDSKESQYDMLSNLELSFDDFIELKRYCEKKEIEFLSTAFDHSSIDFLNELGMSKWKIPSGDITNLPYLIKIAQLHKPIILSTGMCSMEDISNALNVLKTHGATDITVLHCTTEYPAPFKDVNLKAMVTIGETYKLPIGYSDHTIGIEVPIAAVALGATIIEKHFTIDRSLKGPDHKASIEPQEFKAMVSSIRHIEDCLGNGVKKPAESEAKNIMIARKSIVASRQINKGEMFSERNLAVKRPGNGISPMQWQTVIGQFASKDYQEDELIEL
ncbi:N,N'-diacetyllegionaminic acid synthase [Petrocella atlantisensis]|uniref:N,N'-diacetyllegionaminic acid synthase n=1 Tax=Petrocella atlantisensis TaxID=2173034 RepID=A0A3P7P021_9FIRM|nr:N-acetylneuraminate synthase [Petrocella atlantisensis]VDN48545.1 N,N'-diacetyllegionaminic acid synthase [Petrocella atlantisensis]